ncbi:type VI secretion system contractile sheath small subunit [Desulfoluna spongiiphila]|uniref:Type VI secretion system protein ImpB n=1 Tax=Desulfoluna spongiiphila TaxID=419481 RepID=A0A1G5FIQ0_9BACT|nr:type VI secretion system contractile sheath small subunit [Desulfoluna spongiiphila]SCY39037.1 type VI secretion system protein ImpB [Desulfoluna spongiiphila]VVS95583.1 type vi secretion system vipa vc a0107 or hcp2 [Desulfoluna spongiiphila]
MAIQDELPKSRLTLTYRTEIHGEPEELELPLRLLVLGDFTGEKRDKPDFAERVPLTLTDKNTNQIMERMEIHAKVNDSENNTYTLPIRNMDAFVPSEMPRFIPSLQRILEGRKRLADVVSVLDNHKKTRAAVVSMIQNAEVLAQIRTALEPAYGKSAGFMDLIAKPKQLPGEESEKTQAEEEAK